MVVLEAPIGVFASICAAVGLGFADDSSKLNFCPPSEQFWKDLFRGSWNELFKLGSLKDKFCTELFKPDTDRRKAGLLPAFT